jgi:uncharacterized repeat protein (TIGR02543 family)
VLISLGVFTTLAFTGCPQEEEEPDPGQQSQTEGGVLTVTDAKDGVLYEAEVYKYTKAVTDAEALNTVISNLAPTGTGIGLPVDGTLEIGLQKPDGEDFTSNGKFLVVLKDATDDSAPLNYKAAVPFTGGGAAVEYDDMETVIIDPNDPNNPNGPSVSSYVVTFHTNGGTSADFTQTVADGDKAKEPETDPAREGHTFGGWYKEAAGTTKWDFDKDTVTENITLYAKWAVWLLSKRTNYNTSDATIAAEETTEYTSYTDETHYTYQQYPSGTTIPSREYSRDGVSVHDVYIRRSANGDGYTNVYDYVFDADSGLMKQETLTKTETINGVPSQPSVEYEYFYTVTLMNTDADGKKTYKTYLASTGGTGNYQLYTIKDGVALSASFYNAAGLYRTETYTFPVNPVIRERLPKLTVFSKVNSGQSTSSDRHQTCELLESTDTTLTVRIKEFNTSTNMLRLQEDFIYTKKAIPVGPAG